MFLPYVQVRTSDIHGLSNIDSVLKCVTGTMGSMDSCRLRLEITDTGLIEDSQRARNALSKLQDAGIY